MKYLCNPERIDVAVALLNKSRCNGNVSALSNAGSQPVLVSDILKIRRHVLPILLNQAFYVRHIFIFTK